MPDTAERVIASCSFCLQPNTRVAKLVAGPGVYICDACVTLCAQIIQDTPDASPRLAPWEHDMALPEVLSNLPHIAAASSQLEDNLLHWVRKARALGATWAEIGDALGMTRQSAWERFST